MNKTHTSSTWILTAIAVLLGQSAQAEGWGPLDPARQSEITATLPATPSGFGQPISVRKVWDSLRTTPGHKGLIGAATPYLTAKFPAWSDSLYLDFSKTGNRVAGEKMMWNRFKWLTPLVWAECLENKGRFLPVIEKVLNELVNQPTWTLPAHDGALTNFRRQRYSVDLNSANVAHQLAQTLWLLKGSLSKATHDRVYAALQTRVFAPVKTSYATYTGSDWLMRTNNWNSVCLAGVTGAALTLLPDRSERALFAVAAEKYSKNYLKGYLADGYGLEGLGYYNYGFTDYITLREILWQKTSGKLDLFTDPKVRNIAQYGARLMIQNNVWPTIADCRVKTTPTNNILWYGSRVFGFKLGNKYDTVSSYVTTGNIVTGSLHAFPNSASMSPPPATGASLGLRTEFPDADVFILRPKSNVGTIGVAINGGNNGDSHNHNDLGSFSVVSGNEELMGDPGGPTFYNADVFSGVRYTKYKQFSSWGHPVPVVAGRTQRAGAAAAAKILSTSYSDDLDVVTMDLRAAYGLASVTTLQRTFAYSRLGTALLTVTDSVAFDSARTFETALTTHVPFTRPLPDLLKFKGASNVLFARIDAGGRAFTITSEAVNELGLSFTRIGVKLSTPMLAGSVKIRYSNDSASLYRAPVVVNQAPKIGMTCATAGLVAPATLKCNWNASDTDGTVTVVELLQDLVGVEYRPQSQGLKTSSGSFQVTSLPAGTYSFVPKVTDNQGKVAYGATLKVDVAWNYTLSISGAQNWFGGLYIGYALPATAKSAEAQLFTAGGDLVKTITLRVGSQSARFTSLSGKPTGSYVVRLVVDGAVVASIPVLKR